jgi:hypothetical protein
MDDQNIESVRPDHAEKVFIVRIGDSIQADKLVIIGQGGGHLDVVQRQTINDRSENRNSHIFLLDGNLP